ncbi:hypothetical protein H5410_061508, partial [Solanum commersonii]
EDNWSGQRPLNQSFQEMFVLSLQQEATVADLWNIQGWNLIFRIPLNDWESKNLDISTVEDSLRRDGERDKVILLSNLLTKRAILPTFKFMSGHGS